MEKPKEKDITPRIFPVGCKIVDIRRGTGNRSCYIYCRLIDDKGELLINGSLDYVCKELARGEFVPRDEFEKCFPYMQGKELPETSCITQSLAQC